MKQGTRALFGAVTGSLMIATLAACGGSGGAAGSAVKVQLSIPDPLTSSVGVTAQHFADEVKAKSGGKIIVTVIPNGTSFGGDQAAAVTRLQGGSLDALILSTSVYAATDTKMNAISIPYLFADTTAEAAYLAGEPGKTLLADLEEEKTKGLALFTRTAREITNNKRPITKPADLKGLKIRVPGNTLWTEYFGALGASPTTMAFSEVFTGLQTGTIDGQENPVEVPLTNKLYEVQDYLSMTNHINDAFILALSDKKWSSLDDSQKTILQDVATETATFKTTYDADEAKKAVAELEKQGMKVNELSPEATAEFKKISESLYPKFSELIGKEFFDMTIQFAQKS
jgi:tripartite ATP-independent transporter DctP family solute receptor